MAATAKRPSDPVFVGQVFARSSPILTWRPTLAKRVACEVADEAAAQARVEASMAAVPRASRAPTRRMVAWPVIRKVRRDRPLSRRELTRRAAFVATTLALLLIFGLARAWSGVGHAPTAPVAARVVEPHVLGAEADVVRPVAVASTVAVAPARSKSAPAAAHRGKGRHGRRHPASASR